MSFPGKRVPTEDGRFRVEFSQKELERQTTPVPKDQCQSVFWDNWMNLRSEEDRRWDSLSEEQKTAYQKEHYVTEQYFLKEDADGNDVPYMKWTLNTDWTWNIWDMEKGIEYLHCYPESINMGPSAIPEQENIIEEIELKYIDRCTE